MNRRRLVIGIVALAGAAIFDSDFVRGGTFPMRQEYVAVALNGERFDDKYRTLVLYYDNRGYVIGAYAGCNHFSAEVRFLTGGLYTFGGAFQTAMGCGAKNDAEKVYFGALLRTRYWRISGEKLILAGPGDVLEFEAAAK